MIKLGQNFLTSTNIAKDIVKASDIKDGDVVLEVGPGKGILTEELIKQAAKVVAIEKDPALVDFLKEKFADTYLDSARQAKNLEIIHDDILKIDYWKLIENYKLEIGNFKIVANLPYYITSRFLRQSLSTEKQPKMMVLMIQKEVGERILAKDKKESVLSISVKAYGDPKIIKNVPAKHFIPKPKVDSVVIKIDNISKDFFKEINEKEFFKMVKTGFSQKRKMLKNNLKISGELLQKCGLDEKIRAQNLSLEDWKYLYHQIKEN